MTGPTHRAVGNDFQFVRTVLDDRGVRVPETAHASPVKGGLLVVGSAEWLPGASQSAETVVDGRRSVDRRN